MPVSHVASGRWRIKAGQRRKRRVREAHGLEQGAHARSAFAALVHAGESRDGIVDLAHSVWRCVALQHGSALCKTKSHQEIPLRRKRVDRHPAGPCERHRAAKTHLRRQIGPSRIGQRIDKSMVADSLQGVTRVAMLRSLVDEKSSTLVFRQMGCNLPNQAVGGERLLDQAGLGHVG